MRRIFFILAAISALASCTDFPDLDATASDRARAAPYPRILPLGQILARATTGAQAGLVLGNLPARLTRLRARAARLRGQPVIDDATRARLQAALARHGG